MALSVDFDSSLNPCCELFVSNLRVFVTELQTMYGRNQRWRQEERLLLSPVTAALIGMTVSVGPCVGWRASGLSEQVSEFNLSSEPGEIRPRTSER